MKARNELWLHTFLGFGVNYMLRININIAIVDMVVKQQHPQYINESETINNRIQPLNETGSNMNANQFHWDEYEQNLILSSYFWTNCVLQLPGGMLANRWGTKHMLGFNNLLVALLTFFIPMAASFGFRSLFILRALQGLIAGAYWPSVPPMVARWIPPKERALFVSSFSGSSVGTAFTYFLCGYMIAWYGWESSFYITGALGVLWWIIWVFRIYDTPQNHPWISKEEREYIEQSLGSSLNRKRLPVPWSEIFTSRPVLVNAITQWGANGSTLALLTYTPMYLNYIYGLSIQNTGLWSGVPHLSKWIAAFSFGLVTKRQTCLSITNVRKLATSIGTIAVSLVVYILVFSECDAVLAIIVLALSNTLLGTVAAGTMASVIDMTPNFAGVVQGLIGFFALTPGFIYPLILGYLTQNNQTVAQWQKFFFIASTFTLISGLLFLFFGTSEVQPWNAEKISDKELKILRNSNQEKEEVEAKKDDYQLR